MKKYIYLFSLILLTACSNSEKEFNNKTLLDSTSTTKKNPSLDSLNIRLKNHSEVSNTPKKNDQLNDIALLISGLNVDSNSKYFSQTTTNAWEKYSKKLNKTWGEIKKNRLKKMDEWERKELHDSITKNRVGIYPFSGPDFLTFIHFLMMLHPTICLGLSHLEKFQI